MSLRDASTVRDRVFQSLSSASTPDLAQHFLFSMGQRWILRQLPSFIVYSRSRWGHSAYGFPFSPVLNSILSGGLSVSSDVSERLLLELQDQLHELSGKSHFYLACWRLLSSRNRSLPDQATQLIEIASDAISSSTHSLPANWLIEQFETDLAEYRSGNTPQKLNSTANGQFDAQWQALKSSMANKQLSEPNGDHWVNREHLANWTFWVDWYQTLLDGEPFDEDMLLEIAHIKEEGENYAYLWAQDPAEANRRVLEIYDRFHSGNGPKNADIGDLLSASLVRFELDTLHNLMIAIPFEEDWEHLSDAGALDALLKDVEDFREDLQLFCQALELEDGGMQGVGLVRTYLGAILAEFEKAETVGSLRVGRIAEWRRLLETKANKESTALEFGDYAEPLRSAVGNLTQLLQKHFATTIARFSVLRGIHMEADAKPWDVVATFAEMIKDMRSGVDGKYPALAKTDLAIFEEVLDSLNAKVRELEAAETEEQRSSLQKEIDFQLARMMVSVSMYREDAGKAAKVAGTAADAMIKWKKRSDGLQGLGQVILDFLQN
ncbi:hypothetical protein [Shimia ponticola]|uniref:hypothetical protein n=1 Tax=Shimia ponticola TaxID=2582893 RepID=UPI0011BE0A9F|nr:hypothetical protein [Shimia ponticola]